MWQLGDLINMVVTQEKEEEELDGKLVEAVEALFTGNAFAFCELDLNRFADYCV